MAVFKEWEMGYGQLGWVWLTIGFLGVGIGSVVATHGWNLSGKEEKKKWVWWSYITAGLFIAGFGGICSTWGWDNLNKKGQRDALMFSLVREWNVNRIYFEMPPLYFEPDANNIGAKYTPFPRLEISMVNIILTSNLIHDRGFMNLIFKYGQEAVVCNTYFNMSDETYSKTRIPADKIIKLYSYVKTDLKPFLQFKQYHQELGEILKTKYKKQYDEALEFAYKDDSPKVAKPKENG